MSGPRFGIWAPVYGAFGARNHPDDVRDASYGRTRALIRAAEEWGFDSTLIAQHVTNPGEPDEDVLETWSTVAALAEATSRIELIAAIKPVLLNPGFFAKLSANIAAISDGRLAINLVSGWYLPELQQLGIELLEHDDRYARSTEWLDAVVDLWDGREVKSAGLDGFRIRPVPQDRPRVYFGGESEPARQLAASAADTFFINGRPIDDVRTLIADLRGRPRPVGRAPLEFGLSSFVVVRDTDEEAAAELAALQRLVDGDDDESIRRGTDAKAATAKVRDGERRVGSNGGTLTGLVGSPATVAQWIEEFHDAGVELFMLQFQPLEREAERFAREVIARFR
jgi:alkanesulfonate monooxygenase